MKLNLIKECKLVHFFVFYSLDWIAWMIISNGWRLTLERERRTRFVLLPHMWPAHVYVARGWSRVNFFVFVTKGQIFFLEKHTHVSVIGE